MKEREKELFDNIQKQYPEWNDMPEFTQVKKEPFACINIRFDNEKDLQDFSKLINQKITKKTKSIWYPEKSHFTGIGKYRWVEDDKK